jgi:hypothetical protein
MNSRPTTTGVADREPLQTTAVLRGPRLFVARLAWVVLTALSIGLFVASIPATYEAFRTKCQGAGCELWLLSPDRARALEELGLSVGHYAAYNVALAIFLVLSYWTVGATLFWKRSNNRLVLYASIALVTFGTIQADTLRLLAEANPVWDLPVALVYFVGNVSFFVLFCAFPDGHFVPRWTRWAAAVWIAYHLLYHFFPDSPFSPQSWPALINIPLFLGLIGSLVVAQVYRYRRVSNPLQRRQTKWVVFGFTVAIVVFFGVVLALLVSSPTVVNALVSRTIIYLLCAPLIPLSIGVAILYYRLWDIDLIIRRSLVIGPLLTVLTVVFELANELLLPFIFQFIPALDDSSSINTVVSVLIVVVLLKPLHDRLEAIVKRIPDRFFGGGAAKGSPR